MRNLMLSMLSKTLKSFKSLVMLLCSFSLLLSSCDKGVPEINSGEPVTIFFSVNGDSFGAAEEITRSSEAVEPETVVIPVEGGWYMYATLEPDASDTRATNGGANALVAGTEVRILAYLNDGASPAAQAVYTVDPGGTTLSSASPLTVAPGNYTFVAYAKQNSTLSGLGALATLDPAANDLLWGKADNAGAPITVTASTTININISHLCSDVTAVVKNDKNHVISNTIGGSMDGYTIDLTSGKPVKNTPATTFAFAGWTGSGTPSGSVQTSTGNRLVYTAGDATTTLNLTGLNINSTAIANQTVAFNKALQKNIPYTLTVTFRKLIFAGSYIYWDNANQRMTFDIMGASTDVHGVNNGSNQMKQGVFFKFGSLIGMSPVGAWADAATPIYVPTIVGTAATAWTQTTPAAVLGAPVNKPAWTYFSVPHTQFGLGITDPTLHFVQTVHTADSLKIFKGDICTLIHPDWRLPVSQEFGDRATYSWGTPAILAQGWDRNAGGFGPQTTSSHYGVSTNIPTAAVYRGVVNFPASGYRDPSSGDPLFVGEVGACWSGSIGNLTGYGLYFNAAILNIDYGLNRQSGFSIRCVKETSELIDGVSSYDWGTGDTDDAEKEVVW